MNRSPKKSFRYCSQSGQAVLASVVFFLIAGLALVTGATSPLVADVKTSREIRASHESYFAAESAAEDAIIRIKKGYTPPSSYSFTIGSSTVYVSIAEVGGSEKEIVVSGDTGGAIRKTSARVTASEAGPFKYGIQVGEMGLQMFSNSIVDGNIYSNGSVTGDSNSDINGDVFAVGSISSPRPSISGTKTTGVQPVTLPYVNFDSWRAQANINNDPYIGDLVYSGNNSYQLGPKKIQGNFSISSNAELTVKGPIHITGNATFGSNAKIYLDSSFGSKGTVIVVDGKITVDSNTLFYSTSATPKGYILMLSASTGNDAITLNSNADIKGVVYAPNGGVTINSNGIVTALSGKKVILNSNAHIYYDTGLLNEQFTSGPSGGFDVHDWGEVE